MTLRSYRPAIFNTRVSVALSLCAPLFAAVIVLPFASKHFYQRKIIARGGESASAKTELTYSNSPDKMSTLPSALFEPQSTQFAISRNLIAGGGGTSSGGNPTLTLSGTIGQSAAGTTSSGGQFTVTGGFWIGNSTATPTPTPTPTAFTIFVIDGNPTEAVAIDSVTFVRGPFRTRTDFNFSSDRQTRVILFTTNLGLTQADVAKVTVTAAGISLPVENVGPVTGVAGLDASYIVVRLVDGLPPGNLPLIVIVNGVQSSNSPTLAISP